jgi:hypothetical protein
MAWRTDKDETFMAAGSAEFAFCRDVPDENDGAVANYGGEG